MLQHCIEINSNHWPTDTSLAMVSTSGTSCLLSLDALFGLTVDYRDIAEFLNASQGDQREMSSRVGYVLCQQGKEVQVVASPIGIRQIYWRLDKDRLLISGSPKVLSEIGDTAGLPAAAIFHYLYFHCLPSPLCAYADVAKLNEGYKLTLSSRGLTNTRYWHPAFARRSHSNERAAITELQDLLANAVSRALSEGDHCGAFLSGGLDSSTVAGFAARAQPGIPTVSMGFSAEGFDEMQYARIASRHFRTKPLEYYVTPDDVARTLPQVAAAFSEPFGNSSAAAAYHCARVAKEHGIDTLLAGDGGDEIFGGNERYAKQLVFERFAVLPNFLRAAMASTVSAAASLTNTFPIGKAKSYIDQARIPLPDRLQSYNFLHRIPPEEVFDESIIGAANLAGPLQLLRDEYHTPLDATQVDRMLFLDWKFTLHDNDLVKVNTMCDLAGVKVLYPMLDQSLIEFSMRIPSNWKVRNGELRWFYKRAMSNFLPHEIINKSKHGFGLPFGTWMRSHAGLQKIAEDSLHSLGERRYFRKDFLSRALRLHGDGHATYYGGLVWILTVLELWLQRHMPNAGR